MSFRNVSVNCITIFNRQFFKLNTLKLVIRYMRCLTCMTLPVHWCIDVDVFSGVISYHGAVCVLT